MECDDDQGIGTESDRSLNTNLAIVKEARTVYNQLKMLHFTLKGNHDSDSGMHSDLFLGVNDEELHQGMLSALTDDIISLVMSLDATHFKALLDKSRTTNQEQDEELRRRQEVIMDLECKVNDSIEINLDEKKLISLFFLVFLCLSVFCDGSGTQ